MKSLLSLGFLPRSTDLALLLLRLWLGLTMLILHGWPKLLKLTSGKHEFPDPLKIGSLPSLSLAVAGEVAGAILLVLGLWGRMAALTLAITMGVAWGMTHQMKLTGDGSGELAFIYMAGFLAILFAGSGKFSVDGN
ncbi:DoxX family protein [Luteolibacter yonseiensis]|uniref:DoxX family protein n=1 Tax=Luteolibacter yonseiensis TaxID=1144680 RepID=A0A934R2Q1_9BACT|nr:DoxX family protein [Luteolibacter yonseiensis]MBK1815921.1 DoxX family protein [Luteolibacter yonseiensis]